MQLLVNVYNKERYGQIYTFTNVKQGKAKRNILPARTAVDKDLLNDIRLRTKPRNK